jgi:hypothetical protein
LAEDRPSLTSLAARCRHFTGTFGGTYWRHQKSGGLYQITHASIRECDGTPEFNYVPIAEPEMRDGLVLHRVTDERLDGLSFHRPVSEWLEVTDGPDPKPRFIRVFPKTVYD